MFLLFFQELATQLFGARVTGKTQAVVSVSAKVSQPAQVTGRTSSPSSVNDTVRVQTIVATRSLQLFTASATLSIAPSQ